MRIRSFAFIPARRHKKSRSNGWSGFIFNLKSDYWAEAVSTFTPGPMVEDKAIRLT